MVNDLYIECSSDGLAGRAKERESSRDTPRRRSDSGKGVAHGERTTHTHTHTASTTMTGRSSPLAAVCSTTWIDEVCSVCVRGIMSRASFPAAVYGSLSVAVRSQPARRRRRRWLYIFCNCLSVRASRVPSQQYIIYTTIIIVRTYSRGDSTLASQSVHVSDLLQHPYYYYYTRPSRWFVDGHLSSSNAIAAALTTP